MFTILTVQLTNFRSWVGTHEWVINQDSGLYFLTGSNNDNPRLGRNGVGKSSLPDAITWCLHGKTTRSLRASNVISRGLNTCSVVVRATVGDEEFTVARTQNPNSLKINGEIVDQDTLNKKIRLNFESFLYSIISPQSGSSFLDLSPGEKLNLFSDIMELEYWLEASEKAAKKAKSIEDEKYLTNQAISRFTGIATSLATTISDLKIQADAFDHDKSTQINSLLNKCSKIEARLVKIEAKVSSIESTMPTAKEFEEVVSKLEGYATEQKALDHEILEAVQDQTEIETELRHIKEAKEELSKLGAKCPKCRQKVDESHLKGQLERLAAKNQEFLESKEWYKDHVKSIKTNKNEIAIAAAADAEKFNELKERERKGRVDMASFLREGDQLGYEHKSTVKDIERLKNSANEYESLIVKKTAELEAANQEVSNRKSDISRLNEEWAAAHYWVAGFKRVRLFIIEDALHTLEVEVNNSLAALGMGNWKINFDVERENKSGGLTKGFITLITDPKGFTVPYETLSFGENQRVKLAGCFGLANLIMERVGLSSKFEVYDEITQHMSAEGIEDTLNILRDRALSHDKAIVLIDHQAIEYGDFSDTINIIKDEKGSRFDYA